MALTLTLDELRDRVGSELGVSDAVEITQERVQRFADATDDFQWIHVDPERARSGPFGAPIAHGYLTLALAPSLMAQVLRVEGVSMAVNYGCNRVRFPSPVPVGSQVRLTVGVVAVDGVVGGVQATFELTFAVEGAPKPACVAEVVYRYYT